jgi:hypothetical protein
MEMFGDYAVATNLAYGAIIAANLATPNALDFSLPDGSRLTGHLFGLAWTDPKANRSVLIAEVKDSTGTIGGPDHNEITFADAFTDFRITVKYILGRDRISQHLILHQQLPSPLEWGLTEDAVLEILTEFTTYPEVHKQPSEAIGDVPNEQISFASAPAEAGGPTQGASPEGPLPLGEGQGEGDFSVQPGAPPEGVSLEFITGRAFSLDDDAESHSILVAKTWDKFEADRTFLCEKIPWKQLAPELAKLPPVAAGRDAAPSDIAVAVRMVPVRKDPSVKAPAVRNLPIARVETPRAEAPRVETPAPLWNSPVSSRQLGASLGRDASARAEAPSPPRPDPSGEAVRKQSHNPPAPSNIAVERKLALRKQSQIPNSHIARIVPVRKDPLRKQSHNPPAPSNIAVERQLAFVIDWELVTAINSNLWKGDTTYYVAGPITIKTNVFEGGCVIKFAPTNTAKLTITGPINCLTTNVSPLILTARDDHTVGEKIGNATLNGVYANTALDLNNAGTTYDLHDIRVSHAATALNFFGGRVHGARNVQIVQSDIAAKAYQSTFYLYNALFHRVGTAFAGAGTANTTGTVQHLTINQCADLNATTLALYVTNSLLVAVTNGIASNESWLFSGGWNGTNTDPAAVFATLGAGANYLVADSPYRNAGTTNINATLASAIKQLTTSPPIIAGELTTLGNTTLTLSPQAARDTDTPDLGWHYAPIDYALGGVYLTNTTVILNPGTTIAFYSPTNGGSGYYGIALGDAAKLFSNGTATTPNRIVRYNSVQEQSTTSAWNTPPLENIATDWTTPAHNPELRLRFTESYVPANDTWHFRGYNGSGATPIFIDTQLHAGRFYSGRPTVNITNCLFNRVAMNLEGTTTNAMNPTFRNCLLYGGSLRLSNEVTGTWTFKDNLFDKVSITQIATLTHDYNGYITNASGQWLTVSGSHDNFTNTFGWQSGVLGPWYQPTNSTFRDTGSTNANHIGLYHYTVLPTNVKETNSMVDCGFHYVATINSVPIDTDGDGIPDYLEDLNGNGSVNSRETDWQNSSDLGLRVLITRPGKGAILP